MRQIKFGICLISFGVLLLSACQDIYELEKYQRPDWLAGKLYTQVTTRPDLTVFAACLERTGYDTVLDRTGSFTIYAPTNQAFEDWFTMHPDYNNSVDNIPYKELEQLVLSHIIQNSWSKLQMQSLDIYGWIDQDDPYNNQPRGYKRQTILREADRKYWTISNSGPDQIVDSTAGGSSRLVYSVSRKYAPLFFTEYLSINNLQTEDYAFYYNRAFENGAIYYGNSKITSPEIFAENGFLYEVDQVANPLLNGEQLLEKNDPDQSYSDFLDLIYLFPKFKVDLEATFAQEEAQIGGRFDTLYTLTYPDLLFNIHEELTGPNTSNPAQTLRYQNGLMAPTNDAFQSFVNEELTGPFRWNDFESVPREIKRIIVNAHMTRFPLYPTNLSGGFENGAGDLIVVDEADIGQRYYGSNCSFFGLEKAIVPRAFTSVTGPVYLSPGYSTLFYAIESSMTLPALKNQTEQYAFYVVPDEIMLEDSSLMINWTNPEAGSYNFWAVNKTSGNPQSMSRNVLTKRILNQVGTTVPTGLPRKEFIENLAGNFIVMNNETGTVNGGKACGWGYQGDSAIDVYPEKINIPVDNGETYQVNAWFITPQTDLLTRVAAYPHFMDLIKKAGLYDDKRYELTFTNDAEYYTVFVPSAEALIASGADTLPVQELQNLILYHFIKGQLIWTDGSVPGGSYPTLREDESSGELGKKFSSLRLDTGIDLITILDDAGGVYCEVHESGNRTNVMAATDLDAGSSSPHDFIITGVVHEIDSVLVKYD